MIIDLVTPMHESDFFFFKENCLVSTAFYNFLKYFFLIYVYMCSSTVPVNAATDIVVLHTWNTMTKASRTASTVQNSLEISYGVVDQGGSL